jgi:hypothetical protein
VSDIVERLRHHKAGRFETGVNERLMDEAADSIESLRDVRATLLGKSRDKNAEIERLRGVIEDVRHLLESDCSSQVLADFDEIVAEAEKQG